MQYNSSFCSTLTPLTGTIRLFWISWQILCFFTVITNSHTFPYILNPPTPPPKPGPPVVTQEITTTQVSWAGWTIVLHFSTFWDQFKISHTFFIWRFLPVVRQSFNTPLLWKNLIDLHQRKKCKITIVLHVWTIINKLHKTIVSYSSLPKFGPKPPRGCMIRMSIEECSQWKNVQLIGRLIMETKLIFTLGRSRAHHLVTR